MFFYSPSKAGFFHTDFNPVIPEDAIPITVAEHTALVNDLSSGKEVVIDGDKISTRDKVIVVTWKDIRARRNKLLSKCDYTQVADWPGDKTSWATYRQELRDLTTTFDNPEDVIWPEIPGN